ncbi:MAG: hypothetical protein ABJ013_16745 [Halioglobus sp.]
MKEVQLNRGEEGVITIFVSLVLLILVTLLITTSFSLSTINLRAVGNVQSRDEALSAASLVIEEVLTEDFGDPAVLVARSNVVDINSDGVNDYQVDIAVPICIRATQASIDTASSVQLPGFSAVGAWNTIWEINAVATESVSGASVNVIQGVRILLDETEKNAVCPT